jgi:hypothetical protein
MNIQDSIPVTANKKWSQNPHETREHNHFHARRLQMRYELSVILLTGFPSGIEIKARNPELPGDPEGTRIRLIGQNYFHNSGKIAGALRQQNVAKVLSPPR